MYLCDLIKVSGCSVARYRAWFGTKRSSVRIWPPRLWKLCRNVELFLCVILSCCNTVLPGIAWRASRQDRQFESGHPDFESSAEMWSFFYDLLPKLRLPVMCYFVYILFSKTSNRYYIGQTKNIDNRIIEHNSGQTSSIKNGIPWEIVWSKACSSRSEAVKLEKQIKSRGAARFLIDNRFL